MEEPNFFYDLSRGDCEDRLQNTKDGTFLVRRSESNRINYVLVVNWGGQAHHFKILCKENKYYLEAAKAVQPIYFQSLDDLVCHYKKNKMTATHDHYILGQPYREEFSDEEDYAELEDEEWDLDGDMEDTTTPFFQQQLDAIKIARKDETFMELMKDYVDNNVRKDFQCIQNGKCKAPFVQELVVNAASDLRAAMQTYLTRLEILHKLFDIGSNTQTGTQELQEEENSHDMDALFKSFKHCKESMQKLEKKALHVFNEIQNKGVRSGEEVTTEDQEYVPILDIKPGSVTPQEDSIYQLVDVASSTPQTKTPEFEVTSGPLKSKSVLKIDVVQGKILIFKAGNDKPETFPVDQIHQLAKSKSSSKHLKVKFATNKDTITKNFFFQNYTSREQFCQTIQQVKIVHSNEPTSSELNVFVGTWNMATSNVPEDISSWYKCIGSGKTNNTVQEYGHIASDLYVFGTQESAYYEKEWTSRLKNDIEKTYQREFRQVISSSLWGIRIVILIKAELWHQVNSIKHSSVKTGIANALGNKGAVGVSFNIGTTSFCFVNSHLTSGTERLKRRHQNYMDILRGLSLGQNEGFDITLAFHHVFWMGDLNYRLELEEKDIPMIIKMRMTGDLQGLLDHDQLINEMDKKQVFIGFNETELQFAPTYKYKKGDRSVYDWRKEKRTEVRINVPSWCDRVLWRSYPDVPSCNLTYGCSDSIYTSDHSPVFSTFKVSTVAPNPTAIQEKVYSENDMKLAFFRVEAKVATRSTSKFMLTFSSNCLENEVESKQNSIDSHKRQQESLMRRSGTNDATLHHSYPWWTKSDIPVLNPVLKDPYYLETQHLLIAVKGEDQESYGECVVSLKSFLSGNEQVCNCPLTHFGLETGTLHFVATMKTPQNLSYQPSIQKQIYSLIKVEDDENNKGDTLGKRSKTLDRSTIVTKDMTMVPLPVMDRSSIQQVDPQNRVVENKRVSIADVLKRQSLGLDNPTLRISMDDPANGPCLIPTPAPAPAPVSHNKPVLIRETTRDDSNPPPPPPSSKTEKPPNSTAEETPPAPPMRVHSIERSIDEGEDRVNSAPKLPPKKRLTPSNSSSEGVSSPTLPPSVSPFRGQLPVFDDDVNSANEIRDWLVSINCGQYFDAMISNGYDDMSFYHALTVEDLHEIGISNDADRVKIVMNAQSLGMKDKGLFKV
ncbi:phosphatidylinositol 3,4,5-trisphosphate 5-phosphatase 2A-like isoform X2 [Clytia hemisphaerica]|uniref:phosphatidylinositol 3,4,5-trisphosphate 5-phosphatase 2A-like isoform X2 n=1 Tax=Clytia hemisphaerica TaxID=252671 RepID=UPI0034D42C25